MCKVELCFLQFFIAESNALFLKNDLPRIDLFIVVRDWSMILPEPIVMCPTSEFPWKFFGRPTAGPDASNNEFGYDFIKWSVNGVFVDWIALSVVDFRWPQPSRIIRITFFMV